jgi:hypothetical protein
MGMRVLAGGWAMVALAGVAAASPGDLPDTLLGDDTPPPLTILDAGKSAPCAQKPGLCVIAGARSTIAVAASTSGTAAGTADKESKLAIAVPRFSRAASIASSDAAGTQAAAAATPPEGAPWTVEVTGTLKHPAWAGNALFLFFDLDDPQSIENRQFTALFQAPLKAGAKLAARVSMSPDDGFRAGHSYRLRVVQLINGREIVLGESDLSLL